LNVRAPDSRDKILETAEALFARSGFAGVGMRELAQVAGLSKSALFHHFSTKLELYDEVLDRVLERVESALDSERGRTGSPADRLSAWIDAAVTVLSEDVPSARLMMRSMVEDEPFPAFVLEPGGDREMMRSERRLAAVLGRFAELLGEGIEAGAFRPVSVPDTIQTVLGAIVFHFASGDLGDAVIGEPIFSASAVERRRREVSEFIRRGLLA
jgi:AcrR family transcriptional regulator